MTAVGGPGGPMIALTLSGRVAASYGPNEDRDADTGRTHRPRLANKRPKRGVYALPVTRFTI